jgi:hypothetical protein
MTPSLKTALFRAGKYTLHEAPMTDTWSWSEGQWINWIDQHGKWINPIATSNTVRLAFGHQWVQDPHTGKHRLKLSA